MAKPGLGNKTWTAILSVFVAVTLSPNIVGKHGVGKSLLITALAVGAIWMMYTVIGQVISRAASEELKKRSRNPSADKKRDEGVIRAVIMGIRFLL